MVENVWWLSPGMLKMKVEQRDGADSTSARLAAFLQGRCVQFLLIILLLLDVAFVFGEIFLEGAGPLRFTFAYARRSNDPRWHVSWPGPGLGHPSPTLACTTALTLALSSHLR